MSLSMCFQKGIHGNFMNIQYSVFHSCFQALGSIGLLPLRPLLPIPIATPSATFTVQKVCINRLEN